VEETSNETLTVEGEIAWDGSRAVKNPSTEFRGERKRERERERERENHYCTTSFRYFDTVNTLIQNSSLILAR
jgi:GTP-dependent phosphoenolpyruvate carboxykinase